MQNFKAAYKPFARWLNTLVGRADALTDENRPVLAILALSLGTRSLMALDRYPEAEPLAAEALNLADRHLLQEGWEPVRWAVRRDYGEILIQQAQWQNAHQTLLPILDDSVKREVHTYAAAQEAMGIALSNMNEHRQALEHFWIALETQPDTFRQGLILEHVAHNYLVLGESANAIENFNEAIKFIDRKTHPGITARILTNMAHTLTGINRYGDAIGVYEDAIQMLKASPDAQPIDLTRAYDKLGQSHERQGQLHEASVAYRNALDVIEQHKVISPDDSRQIKLRLARVMVIRADYDTAIPYFEQARDEAQQHGTPQETGNIIRELAEAERDGGRLSQSLKSYEDGLGLLVVEYPSDRAALLRSYGQALAQSQQFEEARKAWNEALELTQDFSPLEIALTHHAIGQAFRAQQDYGNAVAAFHEALKHHPKNTIEEAATYRELGESLFESGDLEGCLDPLVTALGN